MTKQNETDDEEHPRLIVEVYAAHAAAEIERRRGAAKVLDIHPNTLRGRMGKLGIRRS